MLNKPTPTMLKVLIVDDEVEVLEAVKSWIEPLGYEVVALTDSQMAAQRVEAEKFDGVFLDAYMHHLDGFELTRRIRASRSNSKVPIVMLTEFDDAQTMRKGFKCGISLFLGKPLSVERVMGLCAATRGAMLKERRAHDRLPLRTSVVCTWGDYDEKEFRGDILNISEGGLLIESAAGIRVGQEITVQFMLPYIMEPISARARVVRQESPDRIGLAFTGLKPEQRELIQKFVHYGSRKELENPD